MRLHILAVGRLRADPELALYRHYSARLTGPVVLKEIELRQAAPPAERKRREAAALLAALPPRARLVALDAGGQLLTSAAFAARLGAWRDEGQEDVAFAIGGDLGLDPAIAARADLIFALGRVTWPHLLLRGMLAEQLYRAQQILAGHPYHRA